MLTTNRICFTLPASAEATAGIAVSGAANEAPKLTYTTAQDTAPDRVVHGKGSTSYEGKRMQLSTHVVMVAG
jgi:hypothetical protein